MAKKHRRKSGNGQLVRLCMAVCAIILILIVGVFAAQFAEKRMSVKVKNAGEQMTAHTTDESTAHVFMNDRWYRQNDVKTLLVIGIDDYGAVTSGDSYNNMHQADFMMLYIANEETGEKSVIHLNRDTMTDITMLGVTGKPAGVQHAQLALAYNYGRGQHDSSENTVDAVSNLLYGMQIDHYITVTMDAVPIMNDWVGGVTVEILDDMTGADSALVLGEEIKLTGEQALSYVRTRRGLDDSSNINRMERQRQYASAWVQTAQEKLKDQNAVAELVMQMSDCHYSDCSADELAEFAVELGENASAKIYELPGEAVLGEQFMEFHVNDEELQQLVLEVFYQEAYE